MKAKQKELQSVSIAAKHARRRGHELAGAMRMLTVTITQPPAPLAPPDPRPTGWRADYWRRHAAVERSRMRSISVRVSRVSRFEYGHLAEIR